MKAPRQGKAMRSEPHSYFDRLMQQWCMGSQPDRIQTSVRRVLSELIGESLLTLIDPRLEVAVVPRAAPRPPYHHSVWAYFPVHRNRLISRDLRPRPETRVLLVFSVATMETESTKEFEDNLRDHLGHTLLYLCSPKAWNDCAAAQKKWRASRASGRPARLSQRARFKSPASSGRSAEAAS